MKRVVNIKIEVDPEEVEQYLDKVMFYVQLKNALQKVVELIPIKEDGSYHSDKYTVDYQVKYPEKWFLVSVCKTTGKDFLVQASDSREAKDIVRERWHNSSLSFEDGVPSVAFTSVETDPECYPNTTRIQ